MRTLLLTFVVLLAGCTRLAFEDASPTQSGGDGDDNGAGAPSHCVRDSDCATAAATCCGCPAFAVHVADPVNRACASGIVCPPDETCPAEVRDSVRAACDSEGGCYLACVEMTCGNPTSCPTGFAVDPTTGCLSCECAAPALDGCVDDGDCVQTRADCCGCDEGGTDTAVLASEQAAYDATLGCMASPACPQVNVCASNVTPTCVQGRCELTMGGLPPNACGRADLPDCPQGTACTVNADDQASMLGVGVCVPI